MRAQNAERNYESLYISNRSLKEKMRDLSCKNADLIRQIANQGETECS
jgi:hypothetical protein